MRSLSSFSKGNLFLFWILLNFTNPSFFSYITTPYAHERQNIMNALTYVTSAELVAKTLDFIFSDHVRPQDVGLFIIYMTRQPSAIQSTWKRFQAEWDRISKKLPSMLTGSILRSFGKAFTTKELRDELKEFFRQNPYEEGQTAISWSANYADANVAYMSKNARTIKRWLREYLN